MPVFAVDNNSPCTPGCKTKGKGLCPYRKVGCQYAKDGAGKSYRNTQVKPCESSKTRTESNTTL